MPKEKLQRIKHPKEKDMTKTLISIMHYVSASSLSNGQGSWIEGLDPGIWEAQHHGPTAMHMS